MASRLVWFKERLVDVDKATVNILSPTSQYGVNVFEGIRCYWNHEHEKLFAFKLDDHIKRLFNSAKILRLKIKYDFDFMKKSFIETIKANKYREDVIARQTIFLDGFGSWSSSEPTEMFIAPIPKGRQFEAEGIHCCVSSWERIVDNSIPPRMKSGTNYVNSRMAQIEAATNGYDSAILLNRGGKVSEAPGACVFIVRNGDLITPSITASILESITRKVILELAEKELKIKVIERDIDRSEMYISDEMFFCGTAAEITPVLSIDRLEINHGKRGWVTRELQTLFFKVVRGYMKNYDAWLTPILNTDPRDVRTGVTVGVRNHQ